MYKSKIMNTQKFYLEVEFLKILNKRNDNLYPLILHILDLIGFKKVIDNDGLWYIQSPSEWINTNIDKIEEDPIFDEIIEFFGDWSTFCEYLIKGVNMINDRPWILNRKVFVCCDILIDSFENREKIDK